MPDYYSSPGDEGHGIPLPGQEYSAIESWLYFCGLVFGYSESRDPPIELAVETDGRHLVILNITAQTRSAKIARSGLKSDRDCLFAFRAQMDGLPFWERDSATSDGCDFEGERP